MPRKEAPPGASKKDISVAIIRQADYPTVILTLPEHLNCFSFATNNTSRLNSGFYSITLATMAATRKSVGLVRALQAPPSSLLTLSRARSSQCSRLSVQRQLRCLSTTNSRSSNIAAFKIPKVLNEPNHHYAKNSAQRDSLYSAVEGYRSRGAIDVPIVVAGKKLRTSQTATQKNPSDHASTIATYSLASPSNVSNAIEAALAAKPAWESIDMRSWPLP
ncbi:hypothetical protein O1611_g3739 [Lasiodiplodia mahajangana]|uniref:Uncharacterized protein n=1 Tax=Lasiodiplodia mahajangana TaxID=1108764 RepID=A0ACC2JR27_9PEZI|nr:hypothetical protein O1611_g3739 [Lasiodiplodia mahajangana]